MLSFDIMAGASVFIDGSQFPESVRQDFLRSLRDRIINHKFHYDTYKQATKWLALHDAYSPARNDASCARIYEEAFSALLEQDIGKEVNLVSVGTGGGQKEASLLQQLQKTQREIAYTASDASLPLVLTARLAGLQYIEPKNCRAIVCDVSAIECPQVLVDAGGVGSRRILTVFGMMPNFPPGTLLSAIAGLLRPNDLMLLSANLAPGEDYYAGVRAIQPQYENDLTRDWLITILLDSGFETQDGEMLFGIETDASKLHRIVAHFHLSRDRDIRVAGESFSFKRGEQIQLFFSYRYTVASIQTVLADYGIEVLRYWTNLSADEGVFLCRQRIKPTVLKPVS